MSLPPRAIEERHRALAVRSGNSPVVPSRRVATAGFGSPGSWKLNNSPGPRCKRPCGQLCRIRCCGCCTAVGRIGAVSLRNPNAAPSGCASRPTEHDPDNPSRPAQHSKKFTRPKICERGRRTAAGPKRSALHLPEMWLLCGSPPFAFSWCGPALRQKRLRRCPQRPLLRFHARRTPNPCGRSPEQDESGTVK